MSARNTAADSENKIHDDRIAAAYGFRGGLVPGVTIYGYMVPAVVEQWGRDWLTRGGITVRFLAPCYEGATVVIRCQDSVVTAEQEDGSLYASGTVNIADSIAQTAQTYPEHLLPEHVLPEMDARPVASAETIIPAAPLGSIHQTLDVEDDNDIPERLLRMANEILVQNFRMSPWIHAASEVCHHRLASPGQEITVTGVIEKCFGRKGRRFAVAGLAMSTNGGPSSAPAERSVVASIRHTFIYQL